MGNVFSLQNLDHDTVTSYSPIVTPQPHAGETSDSVKESGTSAQPPNPILASEHLVSNISEPLFTTGDALDKYQTISEKLENLLTCDAEEATIDAKEAKIKEVIAEVPAVILRCINRDEAALAAFKGLYENGSNNAHVDATIRDVSKLVVEEGTNTVIYADEDQKFNKDITVGLIRSELLNLAEYNVRMAKLLDAGRNKAATEFANSLIETLVIDDTKVISELHNLVDALAKLAARPGYLESLQRLVEIAKNPATNALSDLSVGKEENAISSRDKEGTEVSGVSREDFISAELVEPDPAAFKEQARPPQHPQSIASMTTFLESAALDIFQTMIMDLDTEGCYLFLNAVANQLRYPNNHTHYFSFVLLYLFAETNQEKQITRVLLERLIVNRPHQWGLLITFVELIKNPRYNFWSRSFTRCAPEIEKLFKSVLRSCGGPKSVAENVISGVVEDIMH
ncbi:CCR4-NOT transcription complex subunit 1 isoform X2 [Olea europaea subsp. europaea]|uniref:CCR4-NOT transcription complex subunit 1 isoform X2 n=1 Tax=Olea europaea subsp. europaea TaxID=158383 RepID=A0A8S0UIF4_OLEEU|nr:CCR4-NOT transcription complex subunit 1 isoform X2 [Olea europaea subsp. europaea]